MLHFINHLRDQGYERLNMGLSPLAGLDEPAEGESAALRRIMRAAYTGGNQIYSFSGLYKFKSKYEPVWQDRYIVYTGGLGGFAKTVRSLMRAMRVKNIYH
jgi:phosphatidylglycerol lysyltransferase